MTEVIELRVQNNTISGHTSWMYLGSERLATDPDDRDFTGALRQFGLKTAIAPMDWIDGERAVVP
jgi:hypothetical protein